MHALEAGRRPAAGLALLAAVAWVVAGGCERTERPPAPGPGGSVEAADADSPTAALRAEVLQLVDRLVEEYPDVPDALFAQGLVYNRFGMRDEAEACFRKCLEINPRFASAYYTLAWCAYDRGDYETCIEQAGQAVENDPEMASAYLLLAKGLMGAGRLQEAMAPLANYQRLAPRSADAYFEMGRIYLMAGMHQDAQQAFQVAVENNPNYTSAYWGLATAWRRLGETDKADEALARFRELKQKGRAMQTARERLYNDERTVRQAAAYAYVTVAKVYQTQGVGERAKACYVRALELDPDDTGSRKLLVSFLEQAKQYYDAAAYLEELAEMEPDDVRHWINLGVIRVQLQQFSEAEKAFRRAADIAPERPESHIALAEIYVNQLQRPADAVRHAREAVRLAPVASNYHLLARACEAAGDWEAALSAALRAAELDPGNAAYRETLRRIQQRGQGGEAPAAQQPEPQAAAPPAAGTEAGPDQPGAAERPAPAPPVESAGQQPPQENDDR